MKLLPLTLLAAMTAFAAGCYGPDREAGDDATRADEGPTAGKPKMDPAETVDQKTPGGGGTTDSNARPEDSSGSEDGPSEETLTPERK